MPNINVHVSGNEDLFDRYDADRTALNPAFIAFMLKQYDERYDGTVPVIHIVSETPIDETRVKTALKRYRDVELATNQKARKHNNLVQLYLFLIGVICIAAGILLTKASTIYLQILSLTAGFAIKEAATIFFMKNPKNRLDRARILFISKAEVKISYDHHSTL